MKDNKQLKMELNALILELNSKYGAYGQTSPSLERQKEIRDRIDEIKEILDKR